MQQLTLDKDNQLDTSHALAGYGTMSASCSDVSSDYTKDPRSYMNLSRPNGCHHKLDMAKRHSTVNNRRFEKNRYD